ncbi:MAG: VWA domain-containing protein [Planctomycetaceae bacterium]
MTRTYLFSTLFFLACGTAQAQSDHYPEVMFILDSSGSMAAQVGGRSKIDAAKSVMHQIVPELNENIRVGLAAYGHRRPGDCSDIEVLVPAGSQDRKELLRHVDQLQPRGRTPISKAILSVAEMLKLKDAETTIVLVSDGKETCGGDPCRVVRELKSTGAKFIAHTIGFGVNADTAKQLQCIAKAGGGTYFSAADGKQLLAALQTVVAELAEKVQKVDPAKIQQRSGATGLGHIRVSMPQGAEISLHNLVIESPQAKKAIRTVDKPKSDGKYPLTVGDYRVVLNFATPSFGRPTRTELGAVRVNRGQVTDLKLGSISFNIAAELETQIAVDEVLIADAGSNKIVTTVRKNGNTYFHYKPKPMVAGIYNVLFRYSINQRRGEPSLAAANVVVQPGKDTVVTLDSGFQLKKAADVVGWELTPVVQQDSTDGKAQAIRQQATVAVRYSSGSKQRLFYPHVIPPGVYDLNVILKGMDSPLPAGQAIEIQQGKLMKFDAGL